VIHDWHGPGEFEREMRGAVGDDDSEDDGDDDNGDDDDDDDDSDDGDDEDSDDGDDDDDDDDDSDDDDDDREEEQDDDSDDISDEDGEGDDDDGSDSEDTEDEDDGSSSERETWHDESRRRNEAVVQVPPSRTRCSRRRALPTQAFLDSVSQARVRWSAQPARRGRGHRRGGSPSHCDKKRRRIGNHLLDSRASRGRQR